MKKLLAAALSIAFVVTFYPGSSPAAATCANVEAAKSMLKK
jgi:fatty acid/phospholipid biosynthesis enzyme